MDQLLPEKCQIEVLKIDTEGADSWVLRGAEGLLRARCVQHIFFELNLSRMKQLGIQPAEPIEFLDSVGYRATPLDLRKTEYYAGPR